MTEPTPTDVELWQLYMQQPGQHKDPIDFARAVLAKGDTPAPVGVEPIGHLYSSGAGEVVYQASYQDGFWQDCSRERYEYLLKAPTISSLVDWTLRILHTAPQPTQTQAGAVPLTDEQIKAMDRRHPAEDLCGWSYRMGVADAERHHGIKGGQHER